MKEWFETHLAPLWKKENGIRIIMALGALGMGLILLSEFLPEKAGPSVAVSGSEALDCEEYRQSLEAELEGLIGQMEGTGKTQVMVMLETGEEAVYALDTQQSDSETQTSHVLLGNGTALQETVRTPRVYGVAVVCQGGGDIRVEAQITEMLAALLGLSTNHISVEKMN